MLFIFSRCLLSSNTSVILVHVSFIYIVTFGMTMQSVAWYAGYDVNLLDEQNVRSGMNIQLWHKSDYATVREFVLSRVLAQYTSDHIKDSQILYATHREDRFVHRMFGVLGEWWLENWWTCFESWFYNHLCISLFVNTFSFPCSQFYHLFFI